MASLADAAQPPNPRTRIGESRITIATLGAISELIAAADLMRRGYHVFRSLSPNCPSDLLIYRAGAALRVEVRTAKMPDRATRTILFRLKEEDKGNFDVLALVLEDDEVYYLPALQSGPPQPGFRITRSAHNQLREWGVLQGHANTQDLDAHSEQSEWPPLAGNRAQWQQ